MGVFESASTSKCSLLFGNHGPVRVPRGPQSWVWGSAPHLTACTGLSRPIWSVGVRVQAKLYTAPGIYRRNQLGLATSHIQKSPPHRSHPQNTPSNGNWKMSSTAMGRRT